jgi:hypothetical protein
MMLSDTGKELIPVMEAMGGWAQNILALRQIFLA